MSNTYHNPDLDKAFKQPPSVAGNTLVYALQSASFFVGFTFFIGMIVNYVRQDDVAGTWLASHNRWQLRTFWFGLLWAVLGGLTVWFVIGWFILAVNAIWMIYRIAKGWLGLCDGKEMYV